jgi:uncharacterized membrane protein
MLKVITRLKAVKLMCSKDDEEYLAWASLISGLLGIVGVFTGISQIKLYSGFQDLHRVFWICITIQMIIVIVLLAGASFLVTRKSHSHFFYWKVYGFSILVQWAWFIITGTFNRFFENKYELTISKYIVDSYPSDHYLLGLTTPMSLCLSLCFLLFLVETLQIAIRLFSPRAAS